MLFPVKGLVNNQVFICEHHKMTNPYSIRPPNFCLLYKSEAKKYQTQSKIWLVAQLTLGFGQGLRIAK